MYTINPNRTDLAQEFKAKPFGEHTPELQALLTVLRGPKYGGNYLLICVKPHREWVLAERHWDRPPSVLPGVYHSRAEGEWAAFKLRWKKATGRELGIE